MSVVSSNWVGLAAIFAGLGIQHYFDTSACSSMTTHGWSTGPRNTDTAAVSRTLGPEVGDHLIPLVTDPDFHPRTALGEAIGRRAANSDRAPAAAAVPRQLVADPQPAVRAGAAVLKSTACTAHSRSTPGAATATSIDLQSSRNAPRTATIKTSSRN